MTHQNQTNEIDMGADQWEASPNRSAGRRGERAAVQRRSNAAQERHTEAYGRAATDGDFHAASGSPHRLSNALSRVERNLYEFVDPENSADLQTAPNGDGAVFASAVNGSHRSPAKRVSNGRGDRRVRALGDQDDSPARSGRKRRAVTTNGEQSFGEADQSDLLNYDGLNQNVSQSHNKLCRAVVDLPLARIKTIMKTSPDVQSVGALPLVAVTKSTELFIQRLTRLALSAGRAAAAQTQSDSDEISYNNLARLVAEHNDLDFLSDVIPKKMLASDWLSSYKQLYEDE